MRTPGLKVAHSLCMSFGLCALPTLTLGLCRGPCFRRQGLFRRPCPANCAEYAFAFVARSLCQFSHASHVSHVAFFLDPLPTPGNAPFEWQTCGSADHSGTVVDVAAGVPHLASRPSHAFLQAILAGACTHKHSHHAFACMCAHAYRHAHVYQKRIHGSTATQVALGASALLLVSATMCRALYRRSVPQIKCIVGAANKV